MYESPMHLRIRCTVYDPGKVAGTKPFVSFGIEVIAV